VHFSPRDAYCCKRDEYCYTRDTRSSLTIILGNFFEAFTVGMDRCQSFSLPDPMVQIDKYLLGERLVFSTKS
jgi:hypothetical protein